MNNKITLITGAGRGIGEEIAKKFYSEGHNLILIVQKIEHKKKLENFFDRRRVKFYIGDLSKILFIKKFSSNINYVDNVINNAAIPNNDFFLKVKERDLDNIMQINFKSIFFIIQIFALKMIKNKIKGCFVNISSQLGHVGAFNRTAYCSSKFALEGLTKSAAMDLGKFGIRINTVAPTKTIVNDIETKKYKKRLKIIKNKIPLNRFSTKEEISAIVYFLTTESFRSITGTSIIADGGWTCGK